MARILGIDPGSRRCGIAISDSARTLAFPRPALAVDDSLLVTIVRLCEEEGVDLVLVGRPLALAGVETASTAAADLFFRSLSEVLTELSVVQRDERLTTRDASASLSRAGLTTKKQRSHIDSAAAVIMVQNYLDGRSAQ